MAKSPAEIREQLSDIEPSERTYAGLGASEVGPLVDLLDDDEGWLAARAVHAPRSKSASRLPRPPAGCPRTSRTRS